MRKELITFDNLPQAVSYLTEQVEKIYQLLMTMQPQKDDPKHQLVDIDKACQIVQKAKPTIYRLVRTGLIPVYKRGKKLYFYEDELLKWIETGKNKISLLLIKNSPNKYFEVSDINLKMDLIYDVYIYERKSL